LVLSDFDAAALTVALMMQIASIRQIELLAMLALPLRRTLHRQTQEF
jgi:hypothetical protein